MARFANKPGTYICNFCERELSLAEFATDNYKATRGKPPGRCRPCDREYARARTAYSPTGRLRDVSPIGNAAAYFRAREICAAHAWGTHSYAIRGGPDDPGQVIRRHGAEYRRRYKREQPTTAELREYEEARFATAERRAAQRNRELDAAAKARAAVAAPAEKPPPPPPIDPAAAARKDKIRAMRAARRSPDWEPEPMAAD